MDGFALFIPGNKFLRKLVRDDWLNIQTSKLIGHAEEITYVGFATEDVLVTAGKDKVLKLWNYSQNEELLFFFKAMN